MNGFTKTGAGTLSLSGTNTYSGTTVISTGTLNYNNPGSQTVTGLISGSGALSQSSGTLTLSGANTYGGNTTINGGRLALGSGVTLPNTPLITVGAGGTLDVSASALTMGVAQTLTGVGAVFGNVTNNGTLTPGGTTSFKLNKSSLTNDVLRVLGTLNYSGTLAVTNLSGSLAGGDTFRLFSAASYTGNFSSIAGSPGAGLDWKFTPANGMLTLFSTVPTSLNVSVTNGSLEMSWPADHLGWTLQVQTNDLITGLGTNWFSVSNTAASTQFTAPMDPASPSVFYRLVYP